MRVEQLNRALGLRRMTGGDVRGLGSFTDDAKAAMAASPDYFLTWYTAKSLLLVGVTAALAYQLGKAAGRKLR